MVNIKKLSAFVVICFCGIASAQALENSTIRVDNQTDNDMWFYIGENPSVLPEYVYGLKSQDTQYFPVDKVDGKNTVTVVTGECLKMKDKPNNRCVAGKIGKSCVSDKYYYVDKIFSITILSDNRCQVTCLNGKDCKVT